MTTPQERLQCDVINGVGRQVAYLLACNTDYQAAAKAINSYREAIAEEVIKELRIRWTIVERPRKQRTLRQES